MAVATLVTMEHAAQMTVLLLEDEPIIQMNMVSTFEELGVTSIHAFSTVEDALDYLAGDTPAFALLDHRLQRGETSDAVGHRLRELGVPFAMCSGLGELWDASPGLADAPVLEKPLNIKDLRTHLRLVGLLQ